MAGKGEIFFPTCTHKHNKVSGAYMVLSSQVLSLRLLHSNQEVCTLEDPRKERKGGRGRWGGEEREGEREGGGHSLHI